MLLLQQEQNGSSHSFADNMADHHFISLENVTSSAGGGAEQGQQVSVVGIAGGHCLQPVLLHHLDNLDDLEALHKTPGTPSLLQHHSEDERPVLTQLSGNALHLQQHNKPFPQALAGESEANSSSGSSPSIMVDDSGGHDNSLHQIIDFRAEFISQPILEHLGSPTEDDDGLGALLDISSHHPMHQEHHTSLSLSGQNPFQKDHSAASPFSGGSTQTSTILHTSDAILGHDLHLPSFSDTYHHQPMGGIKSSVIMIEPRTSGTAHEFHNRMRARREVIVQQQQQQPKCSFKSEHNSPEFAAINDLLCSGPNIRGNHQPSRSMVGDFPTVVTSALSVTTQAGDLFKNDGQHQGLHCSSYASSDLLLGSGVPDNRNNNSVNAPSGLESAVRMNSVIVPSYVDLPTSCRSGGVQLGGGNGAAARSVSSCSDTVLSGHPSPTSVSSPMAGGGLISFPASPASTSGTPTGGAGIVRQPSVVISPTSAGPSNEVFTSYLSAEPVQHSHGHCVPGHHGGLQASVTTSSMDLDYDLKPDILGLNSDAYKDLNLLSSSPPPSVATAISSPAVVVTTANATVELSAVNSISSFITDGLGSPCGNPFRGTNAGASNAAAPFNSVDMMETGEPRLIAIIEPPPPAHNKDGVSLADVSSVVTSLVRSSEAASHGLASMDKLGQSASRSVITPIQKEKKSAKTKISNNSPSNGRQSSSVSRPDSPIKNINASNKSSSNPCLLCAVCGDNAACQHYGVRTCEGCKGFFKRTVQKNAKYVCLADKNCPVDKRRRNRCQFCRFQKCLNVGMVKEVVRTDSLKGRRGRLPTKPRGGMVPLATQSAGPTNGGPSSKPSGDIVPGGGAGAVVVTTSTTTTTVLLPTVPLPLPLVTTAVSAANRGGGNEPLSIVTALVRAHIDTSPKLENLDYSQYVELSDDELDSKSSLISAEATRISQFYSILSSSIGVLLKFCERIPGYLDLCKEDRDLLFRSAFLELFTLRLAHRSRPDSQKFTFCSGTVLHRNQVKTTLADWLDGIGELSKSLQQLDIDASSYACLAALTVINERHGLTAPKRVEALESRILGALRSHVTGHAHAQKKPHYLTRILEKLQHLRTLSQQALQRIFYLRLVNLVPEPPALQKIFSSNIPF